MLAIILFVAALVFGLLAVLKAPERFSYAGAGVICLAAAHLIGQFSTSL